MLRSSLSSLVGFSFALASLACSDAADPIAQAQTQFRVKPPASAPTGTSCTSSAKAGIGATEPLTPGGDVGVPDLPPANSEPTFAGGPVADGQETPDGTTRYRVKCTMSGSENVRFRVQLEGPDTVGAKGKTNIDAQGTVNAETGAGEGRVAFFTTEVLNVEPADGVPCTFQVVTDTRAGGLVLDAEEAGRMWVTFQCPGVRLTSSEGSYCASEGTIVATSCALGD